MEWIRLHVRVVVVAWLLGQAVAVSAVSLGDCCAGHRGPAIKAKSCHDARPPAAAECPMRAADGRACQMHRNDADRHASHETPRDATTCTLKSTCGGPVAMLASLFFVQGVLPTPAFVPIRLDTPERVAVVADASFTFVISPDSPPPRRWAL